MWSPTWPVLRPSGLEDGPLNRTPRLELVEHLENAEAHGHLVDKVSDTLGAVPRGPGSGAMSDGERHNIQLEMRKRYVRQLGQRLNILARNPEVERCFLAASKEINHQLVEELDPQVRAKIEEKSPANLMKVERVDILGHF